MAYVTVIATIKFGDEQEEIPYTTLSGLRGLIEAGVASLSGELIPCGWAPDVDTICEAAEIEFGTLELLDCNPMPERPEGWRP